MTDQLVPYVRPQENGGHADVRWLELRDGSGAGLRITLDVPRQVSVSHVRAADLASAGHDVEVMASGRAADFPFNGGAINRDVNRLGCGGGAVRSRRRVNKGLNIDSIKSSLCREGRLIGRGRA